MRNFKDEIYAYQQPSWRDDIQHHGILGQKWGVRRYQNPDGSLTEAGKRRYSKDTVRSIAKNGVHESLDKIFNDPTILDYINNASPYKEYKNAVNGLIKEQLKRVNAEMTELDKMYPDVDKRFKNYVLGLPGGMLKPEADRYAENLPNTWADDLDKVVDKHSKAYEKKTVDLHRDWRLNGSYIENFSSGYLGDNANYRTVKDLAQVLMNFDDVYQRKYGKTRDGRYIIK